MSARVGYSVIYASSHENSHSAQELEIRNNNDSNKKSSSSPGRGWQSARFCDYPQYLVLSLHHVTSISQIQLLSHQSKISSKIEIWIGLDIHNFNHDANTFKSINWKRLGYLSLDKNERSNWKARELKSVYIDCDANYIKFSLHESHINTINLFNQVGIIAISILGNIQQKNIQKNTQKSIQNQNEINNSSSNNNTNTVDGIKDIKEIDDNTAKKIRELTILKKQAVELEDYDEAKRCKLVIESLKKSATKLFELENQKKIAVQREDYDTAKQLKSAILQLRSLSLNPDATMQSIPQNNVSYPPQQRQQQQIHPVHQKQQMQQQPIQSMQPMQQSMYNNSIPPSRSMQRMQQSMYTNNNSMNGIVPQQQQQPQQHQLNGYLRPNNINSRSHSQSMSPAAASNLYNNNQRLGSENPDERAIRPLKRNFGAIDVTKVDNPFGDNAVSNKASLSPSLKNIQSNNNNNNNYNDDIDENNPNLNDSSNNKDKDGPEELSSSQRKGSEKLISMFGEHIIRLINSSSWSYRDEGLNEINKFLQKKEHPDNQLVFKLTTKIIYKLLRDRVAGIILSSIATLNVLISVYCNNDDDDELDANEITKNLYSIIIILVNILGHSNNRLIDSSGSILINLCNQNDNLCKTIYNVLIKKMKKILPKHLRGRGLILLQLINQFNVPSGIDISLLMDNIILPQLKNKNGDIRDIGIQIVTILYSIYNQRIVQYLENGKLNDFIKETLNNSFKKISGNDNVLEREQKSSKEQQRPSKTMNRAQNNNISNKKQTKKRRKKNPKNNKKIINSPPSNIVSNHINNENEQENNINNNNNGEEREDICNFCGLQDESFIENEENLDLHYWQNCPMLTSCKLCEQVIEIATLHEHILTECESNISHILCKKCNIPYPDPINDNNKHHKCISDISSKIKCPLCLENIKPENEKGWKLHLLKYPGCKSNERPLVQ